MSVPTLSAQRQTDVARFYDADLPNVETASTVAVSGDFLVRMVYPDQDPEGGEVSRDMAWAKVLKSVWPEPAYKDTLMVSGEQWRVALVTHADAWQWRMKIEKNVRVNFGA